MILFYVFLYFSLSSAFIDIIDKKTQYNGDNYKIPGDSEKLTKKHPDKYIFLIILLGPFSYFFIEKIKKWRKINYYKYKLTLLKKYKNISFILYDNNNEYNKEIIKIERKLALEKINKKWIFLK